MSPTKTFRALSLVTVLLAASDTAAALGQGATGAAPKPDPLVAVNAAARAEYAEAKAAALARVGPVIVVYEGDKVALVRNGARAEAKFVPPTDADLKAVGHVTLGLFAGLSAVGDGPVAEDRLAKLAAFRAQIAAARDGLEGRGFATAVLERQRRILAASLELVDGVLARKQARSADVTAYARAMSPLVLANVAEAARAQIDGLHARVSAWRREMSPDEWKALHVVVIGVHMAREDELATQYFLKLLGEPEEGRRVVFAEGLWDEARALDLLGTHLVDGRVGAAFFGSDLRMHRDILGNAASAYLDELGLEP